MHADNMQNDADSVPPQPHLVKLPDRDNRRNGRLKPRRKPTDEEMAALPENASYLVMACGTLVTVDSDNIAELSKWSWSIGAGKYPSSRINRELILLHRLVANTPDGMDTDHKDGNTFNARRSNLRICTTTQNCCNKVRQKNNTSGHVGVSWAKNENKWRVQVKINRKVHCGGYFSRIEDAIHARTELAKRLHGNFVKIA